MKKEIQKFDNIKEIIYHSATVYSDNIAFTTKIKTDGNTEDVYKRQNLFHIIRKLTQMISLK